MNLKDAVVLLIEDNPAEQNLAKRSFEKGHVHADLRMVSDGEEALDYLLHRAAYAGSSNAPTPDIILLDLNIPKLDGRQVLAEIKKHKNLARIPVIVLTNSKKEEDVLRSYELGCSSFLTKPVEVNEFIQILREIGNYWLKLVVLPPKE